MIPKIRRDLQQIADMCGVQERVGVSRTPRYRKDETRSIDEEEISKEGKPSNREGDLRGKIYTLISRNSAVVGGK